MKFGNHGIYDLIKNYIPIKLTKDEGELLKSLSDHISWGKYPEKIKPSLTVEWNQSRFNPKKGWDPDEFKSLIDSIKSKLDGYYKTI